MKSVRLALMPLLLGACAVHINAGGGGASSGSPPPRTAAAQPAPAPRPAAAPAPAPAPGPAPAMPQSRMGRGPAATPPVAAAGPAPMYVSRLKGLSHVAPAPPPPPDTVNTVRLKSAVSRNAKGCGLKEIDTNVFTRIDCHDYAPIAAAVPKTSARKLRLVQKKQTVVRLKRRTSQAPVNIVSGVAPAVQGAALFEKDDVPLPDEIDLKTMNAQGPIKNQLSVGSCTAFSLSAAMDNALMRIAGRNNAGAPKVVSPIDLWSEYGTPKMEVAWEKTQGKAITDVDHWSYTGSQACKLVRNPLYDDCHEAYNVMPGTWESDPLIKQSMATAKQAGIVTLNRVESFKTLPHDNDELITSLRAGTAIWAAMKIDGNAWSNRSMKDGVIQDWAYPSGGHAIAITGFRKTPAGYQYLIQNSWGTSWGKDGRAWVNEAMLKKFMHYAYKIHVEGDDVQPPTPPPAPPGQPEPPQPQAQFPLSDDDCDQNSLVDLLYMKCAAMCPDDNRPWGGQCPTFASGAPKK